MNILRDVTLSDKYALECGQVYMTGTQALVRLPMLQRQRDLLKGLNTACFISGYRGSPLGNLDRELWRAKEFNKQHHIEFEPGINEELGATAVWGSQQVGLFPGAKYDGVYGMWYGKTPGVDRSGDVLKHANYAGTSPNGGVLVLAGDDHNCKSSTIPCQSEYAFMDAQIPVFNPSNVQEFLDYGVLAWEMSRFSGCWVGMKTISETVDASASVYVNPNRVQTVYPDFSFPEDGVHIRWPDKPLDQEYRLQKHKLYAAIEFVRANKLDKVMIDSPQARLGIITSGKSYQDVLQAMEDLGIDQKRASQLGIRLYKVAVPWPLEPEGIKEFTKGLDEILVVEEKRAVIENQLKEQLYNWAEEDRPRVFGKFDDEGEWILPSANELSPARIARVIAERVKKYYCDDAMEERLAWLDSKEEGTGTSAQDNASHTNLLFRLSAQHLNQGTGWVARTRWYWLSLYGDMGTCGNHPDLYPDGRRRCAVGWPKPLHRRRTRLCQPRRWHLLPFWYPRHSSGTRRQRQHYL